MTAALHHLFSPISLLTNPPTFPAPATSVASATTHRTIIIPPAPLSHLQSSRHQSPTDRSSSTAHCRQSPATRHYRRLFLPRLPFPLHTTAQQPAKAILATGLGAMPAMCQQRTILLRPTKITPWQTCGIRTHVRYSVRR